MTNRWTFGIKPVTPDDGDVENLAYTKICSAGLQKLEDAPLAAADIAKDVMTAGLKAAKNKTEARMVVRRVCRGTLRGMADVNQDLAQTARFLLTNSKAAAEESKIDPKDMVTWSLEGMADVTLLAGQEQYARILKMIDYAFPGTGAQFTSICTQAKVRRWWTK